MTKSRRTKTPAPRPANHREEIVRAAMKCFAKNGIANTRMNEIAAEAGVKPPHFKYYFRDFDQLFEAVVQEVLLDMKRVALELPDQHKDNPLKALESYMNSTMNWVQNRPQYFSIWIYYYHTATVSEASAKTNFERRKVARERISLLLYKALEKNQFKLGAGSTVSELAMTLHSMLEGFCVVIGTESPQPFAHFKTLMARATDAILGRKHD